MRKTARERRRNVRFSMALPVRYTLARACGWGRIVNIGSGGALLTVDQPVMAGHRVELCIGWPVLLHEKVHLNLVANGVILRVEKGRAAVRFERCHFRTASAEFRRRALLPELRGAAWLHG
ncbi:MAG: PilZ domain-containing protein [Bryobacteraceae bacterium]